MKRRLALFVLLLVVVLGVCLAGAGSTPLWDRDEGWYAQTSRQMLGNGSLIIPKYLDQFRYSKPPFVYWTQAVCMKAFGPTVLAARMPSALAMTGCAALLGWVFGVGVGWRRGLLTALVYASSAMALVSAKMCLIDSTLMFFLTLSQIALYRILTSEPEKQFRWFSTVHLFWIALTFTAIIKGPVALVILILSAVVYSLFSAKSDGFKSSFSWISKVRILRGVVIVSIFIIPWLLGVYLKNSQYFKDMMMEPFRHASSNQEGHSLAPGYHLGVIWITFFPWSLFLPIAIIGAWKHRRLPQVRFALSTVVSVLVLSESMATKLPHYMLPAFPALAFLTADAIVRIQRKKELSRPGIGMMILLGLWALFAAVFVGVTWLPMRYFPDQFPLIGAIGVAIVGAAFVGSTGYCVIKGRWKAAPWCMGLGMLGVFSVMFLFYLPNAGFLGLSKQLGGWLNNHAKENATVGILQYSQPTVPFYYSRETKQISIDELVNNSPTTWADYIIVPKDVYEAFLKEHPEKGNFAEIKAKFRGLNYNVAAKSDIYSRLGVEFGPDYPAASSPLMIQDVLILQKQELVP